MDNEILLKRAKEYIDNMARGIDPITGELLEDDNVINNVKVSRCLFYVSNVLNDVIEENFKPYRKAKVKKKDLPPFYMTLEEISSFQTDSSATYISKFAESINTHIADESRRKLTYRMIANWLVTNGYLIERVNSNGKMKRYPTAFGNEVGFYTEKRTSSKGDEYDVILIGKTAKQFIIQHINEIAESVDND